MKRYLVRQRTKRLDVYYVGNFSSESPLSGEGWEVVGKPLTDDEARYAVRRAYRKDRQKETR